MSIHRCKSPRSECLTSVDEIITQLTAIEVSTTAAQIWIWIRERERERRTGNERDLWICRLMFVYLNGVCVAAGEERERGRMEKEQQKKDEALAKLKSTASSRGKKQQSRCFRQTISSFECDKDSPAGGSSYLINILLLSISNSIVVRRNRDQPLVDEMPSRKTDRSTSLAKRGHRDRRSSCKKGAVHFLLVIEDRRP